MRSRRRGTRRVSPWTLVATLVAVTPLGAQAVRDSAGIQIVSNERPLLPAAHAWRIDERPMLRIGGDDAPPDTVYEFALIMGVSRMSDGRWAVGVQSSHVIRFFDGTGKFVGSAGRQGQGPGEFQQVMGTRVIRGDTVVVSDLGQVEYFSSDGRFARQGASRTRMAEYAFPWIVMRDGTYLSVAYRMNVIPSAGRSRRMSPILHVSDDGAQMDSIGLLQRGEEVYDGRQPFGRQVVFSAPSALAADNRRLLVSDTDRAEIAEHTLTGRLTRVIRLPHPRRPVTDEALEAYRAYVKAMPGEDGRPMPPAMRARFDQMLERATFAREFSPFGNMIVDAAGHLWVQHYDYRSAFQTPGPVRTQTLPVPSRWDVIDLTGRWLCTVELPARFTPSEIGVDYVAGMARDEDDVERVEVYRLRKPGSGQP